MTMPVLLKIRLILFGPLLLGPLALTTSTTAAEAEKTAPAVTQSRPQIPFLTDGKSRELLQLTLVLDQARTLRSVTILTGADASALTALSLDLPGDWKTVAGKEQDVSFQGETPLPVGVHRFSVKGCAATGLDLLTRLQPRCIELSFAEGAPLRPQEASMPPLRPAISLHQRGQFQCHTFRIPAIARAKDGSLLAVYDMRYLSSRDLQGHMDIGLSRSTDGGQTWADPVPIMDMGEFGGKPQGENGCSDPGILVDPQTGEIFISAVWTHGKPGTHQWTGKGSEPGHDLARSSQFMVVRSRDHGKTWSAPENWTTKLKDPTWHLFAPAPGNGIALRDGTLIMPTQGRDAQGKPFSNIMASRDHGATWIVSSPARSDTTECAVAELSDGSLLLNMRDNRNRGDQSATNGRALSVTRDLGKTWSIHPADHGTLPEPVCMASMISHALPDGRHALIFSNPRHKSARRDMTVQISFDDGKTWPEQHHILLDNKGGSYSTLVMIDPQTLGILYESSQADLVFQKIPLSELIPGMK